MQRQPKSVRLGLFDFIMTRSEVFYLLPYFTSLALSLGILFTGDAAAPKGILSPGILVKPMGPRLIIELLSRSFWENVLDGFQWLAGLFLVVAFPVLVQYTEYKFIPALFILSLIVPVIFVILMTDGYHHLIYANPTSADAPSWLARFYLGGLWNSLIYGNLFWGVGLLITLFRLHGLYRSN
jgi:hypothetical protein